MTYSDLITQKARTASAVADDLAKLATDQKTVADDQAKLSADQGLDAGSDAAIAASLAAPGPGVFVDTANPNPDGTVNVYIRDTSPVGYHVVAAPTSMADVPAA